MCFSSAHAAAKQSEITNKLRIRNVLSLSFSCALSLCRSVSILIASAQTNTDTSFCFYVPSISPQIRECSPNCLSTNRIPNVCVRMRQRLTGTHFILFHGLITIVACNKTKQTYTHTRFIFKRFRKGKTKNKSRKNDFFCIIIIKTCCFCF